MIADLVGGLLVAGEAAVDIEVVVDEGEVQVQVDAVAVAVAAGTGADDFKQISRMYMKDQQGLIRQFACPSNSMPESP